MSNIRIGVDFGGTKIEIIALDCSGNTLISRRIATPKGEYRRSISDIANLVFVVEAELNETCSIGVSMPGSFSRQTGRVRNANSTWLNDQPFDQDLQALLGREIRFANDANCLALSEAIDGAGAGCQSVFAIILGTGVGGALAFDGKVHQGFNSLAGEWGHNPLPWIEKDELPGPECYCCLHGCIETFLSGPGFSHDYFNHTERRYSGEEIVTAAANGEPVAQACIARYQRRLANSIASIANIVDPDVFILGGGMSNISQLYDKLADLVVLKTFGGEFNTPILPAKYGDSSGVRGAARLW